MCGVDPAIAPPSASTETAATIPATPCAVASVAAIASAPAPPSAGMPAASAFVVPSGAASSPGVTPASMPGVVASMRLDSPEPASSPPAAGEELLLQPRDTCETTTSVAQTSVCVRSAAFMVRLPGKPLLWNGFHLSVEAVLQADPRPGVSGPRESARH